MAPVSFIARAVAEPEVFVNLLKASFEGARMVTLDREPSDSARPGTLLTAVVNNDRDEVAPRRSVRDMLEF